MTSYINDLISFLKCKYCSCTIQHVLKGYKSQDNFLNNRFQKNLFKHSTYAQHKITETDLFLALAQKTPIGLPLYRLVCRVVFHILDGDHKYHSDNVYKVLNV